MTGTQFLSELGFGQVPVTPTSFPEYPPHNARLQALAKQLPEGSTSLDAVYALLLYARQLHGQANFAEESRALTQADLMLDALASSLQAGMTTKTLAAVVVLILLGALAYAYWPQIEATTRPRSQPRKNPGRRSRKSRGSMPPWLKDRLRARKARARTRRANDNDNGSNDDDDDAPEDDNRGEGDRDGD